MVNFSGRLPFTVARREEDYPSFKYIGQHPYEIEYGYYHGYTKLDKEGKRAAYPFGYGLSYTRFALDCVHAQAAEGTVTVTATVKNLGDRAGAEVIQVYAGSKGAVNGDDRPIKLLKGFQRVDLKPGEEQTITITIASDELRFYDHDRWILDPAYQIYVGTHAENAADHTLEIRFD